MMRLRLRFKLALLLIILSLAGPLAANLVMPGPAAATNSDALIFSLLHHTIEDATPDLGPLNGTLTATDNEPVLSVVGIGSRDFAVRVTCLLPVATETNPSDCGIAFRRNTAGQSLLVTVTSDGAWTYGLTGEEPVQSGEADTLLDASAGSAVVELFTIGLTGYAGLNGVYLATLDLSLISSGGALAIGTGFAQGGGRSNHQLEYQDLSIWSFDDVVDYVSPIEDEFSPESQFGTVVESITASEPLIGPQEGLLFHTEGQATYSRTGVQVSDIVARLECGPPSLEGTELWDCGIVFRLGEAVDDQFRLIFLSTGRWILAKGAGITIQDGYFDPPSGGPEARLHIELVAVGDTGWLGINGVFAGTLDLSLLGDPGDIAAASAFFASTYVPGGSTPFQEFTIWDADLTLVESLLAPRSDGTPAELDPAKDSDARLFAVLLKSITSAPPEFGPESGVMKHDPATVTLRSSDVKLENLAARLQCAAPPNADSRLWDCGIVWRSNGSDAQLRLAVVSDGFWSLRTGGAEVIANGSGLSIDNSPGALLTIDVLALDDAGYFAVNNTFVARLDLSSVTGMGDTLAGTAFFNESYADGGSTIYDQFAVWSVTLQSESPAAAPTETPAETLAADIPVPANASPTSESGAPAPLTNKAVDIDSASPGPESSPATLEDVRAIEPSSQANALIQPLDGQQIHGYGVATRVARSIEFSILITNAPPGSLVALQPGACGQLSDDLQGLEPVGALNGQGIVLETLPIRLAEILNNGVYSLVVYAAADNGYANPLACGELIAD